MIDNGYQKHTGNKMPSDLAEAQIIYSNWPESIKPELKEGQEWRFIRADLPLWVPGVVYTETFDCHNIRYCSSEGLRHDAKYVVTNGEGVAFQILSGSWPPCSWDGVNWIVYGAQWDYAPADFVKPGHPANSLMRVWR